MLSEVLDKGVRNFVRVWRIVLRMWEWGILVWLGEGGCGGVGKLLKVCNLLIVFIIWEMLMGIRLVSKILLLVLIMLVVDDEFF